MANARKCDRCGEFYDPFQMTGMICKFENPRFQTSNDIREGVIGKLMFDCDPDAFVDLCPTCSEMFENFMCGSEPATTEKLMKENAKLWTDNAVMKKNLEMLEKRLETRYEDILFDEVMDSLGLKDEDEMCAYLIEKTKEGIMEAVEDEDAEKIKSDMVDILRHALFGKRGGDRIKFDTVRYSDLRPERQDPSDTES